MGRLIEKLLALFAYVCIATIVAQGSALAWLASRGMISEQRVHKLLATAQGIETDEAQDVEKSTDKKDEDKEDGDE